MVLRRLFANILTLDGGRLFNDIHARLPIHVTLRHLRTDQSFLNIYSTNDSNRPICELHPTSRRLAALIYCGKTLCGPTSAGNRRTPMSALGQSRRFGSFGRMSGHWVIADMAVALEDVGPDVIQAPKREPRIMRYELSDYE